MSTGDQSHLVFKGVDGNECEEFVAAVEELAFVEGWSRDRERMLLFARGRLRHKALRWFATLDPSKKEDWNLFVEALFNQYPLVEPSADETGIATPIWSATTFSPAPSTAILPSEDVPESHTSIPARTQGTRMEAANLVLPTPRAYDSSLPGRQVGRLRIVFDESSPHAAPEHVWRGLRQLTSTDGSTGRQYQVRQEALRTTVEPKEALVVGFLPSSEPHQVGCLNTTVWLGDLSVSLYPSETGPYTLLAWNGVVGLPEKIDVYCCVSKIWKVLPDGSLEVSLLEPDKDSYNHTQGKYTRYKPFKTTEVFVDTSGSTIFFVVPGTSLWQDDPNRKPKSTLGRPEVKARLVFEPL